MSQKASIQGQRPILACVDNTDDLQALQGVLTSQSANAAIYRDISELCIHISDRTDAVFISGDMVTTESYELLAQTLDRQPDWSDLPIIFSVPGGPGFPKAGDATRDLGNLFLLQHPLEPAALKNALHLALRGRDRQRWIRDLSKECEHATRSLKEARKQLDRKIRERTDELVEEASQLRRLTGALIISEQKERRRMGQVLNDSVQQLLAGAKYRLTSLNQKENPAGRATVQEIETILGEAMEASRSLTSELTPPIIYESSLRTGMEWLISYMSAQHGLSVRLHMKEEFNEVDENMRGFLFDATRELLVNVMRHGKTGAAELSIQRADENMLEIQVTDQGPGFPLVPEPKGLGLFRIRQRLDLVSGRLEIKSAPKKGSQVRICLPLAPKFPTTPETWSPAEAIPRSERLLSGMIRLLIVDDHAVMRQGLSTSLGQEPDIAIIGEAVDGKAAIEKARGLHPDVILMDLGMPRMSGIEATKVIHNEMPRVRVIGLSMFEEKEQANAMFEAGAVAYLSKGCSVDALTSTIRRCVGKPELPAGHI